MRQRVSLELTTSSQQDEPVTLQELLGRFEKYAFVPDLFTQILKTEPKKPEPAPKPVEQPKFDTSKEWKKTSKIRLWTGVNTPDWTIAVRDGNPSEEAAGPKSNVR